MDSQPALTWTMRSELVEWLMSIHTMCRMHPETLHLTVNILDRFLSLRQVDVGQLQLMGMAALWIASKYEEKMTFSVELLVYVCDGAYSMQEIVQAERYMLQVLEYGIFYAGPLNFLRRINKAEDYDWVTREMGKYLLEETLLMGDGWVGRVVPSKAAAACVYIARKLCKFPWDDDVEHFSGYRVDELEPVAEAIVEHLQAIGETCVYRRWTGRTRDEYRVVRAIHIWLDEQI
jgi:G2/mitotic-specific cyclin 1/2